MLLTFTERKLSSWTLRPDLATYGMVIFVQPLPGKALGLGL